MSLDDFSNLEQRYQNTLEKLRDESRDVCQADREAIEQFLHESSDCEPGSLQQYCRILRLSAERADMPLVEMEHEDAKRLFHDLRHNPEYGRGGTLSPSTVANYQTILQIFLLSRGEDWAEDIEPDEADEQETINPNQVLSQDDIAALVDAADRQRDIAMIEFLADTGARLSLMGSLRVKDVDLEGDRATYTPNDEAIGLKGAEIKPYPIIDAQASLRSYLNHTHPRPDRDDVALFHAFKNYDDNRGSLSPSTVGGRLRDIAADAGVDKPCNPHNFRHSAVTRMYREGYDKSQIRHRVQWSLKTDMWDRYVHLEAEQVNDDIFAAVGVIDEEEGSTKQRKQCGNCREVVAAHADYCSRCGTAVSVDARDIQREAEDDGIDSMADEKLSPGERRIVQRFLDDLRNDPSMQLPVENSDAAHSDAS